jgi:hypothetical protein
MKWAPGPFEFASPSLWKASLSQTIGEQGEILVSAEWREVSEVRDAQTRAVFQCRFHDLPCWFQTRSKRIAGGIHTFWQQ